MCSIRTEHFHPLKITVGLACSNIRMRDDVDITLLVVLHCYRHFGSFSLFISTLFRSANGKFPFVDSLNKQFACASAVSLKIG